MQPTVTDRVLWSVDLSVCHSSQPYKTAEPIQPFELRTRVSPRNRALDEGSDPTWEGAIGAILRWKGRPIIKYRDALP